MKLWQRITWPWSRRRTPGRHVLIDTRLLDWVTCMGCGMRVPADALHGTCGRAAGFPILIRATKHGPPCCPGICRRCDRCLEKQGWCLLCITCKACCPGHYRELPLRPKNTIEWRDTGS
jgi:hypothetical protein